MLSPRIKRFCALTLLGALLLSGCGVTPTAPNAPPTAPSAPPTAPTAPSVASTASNKMGFAILDALAAKSGAPNQVISPISIAALLTMLLHGADGETNAAIAKVLQLTDPDDQMAPFALLQSLTGKADGVELSVANSLWPQTGYPVRPDYLTLMQQSLGATVREVDLGDPKTAATIDQWVSDQTRGLIKQIAADLGLPDASMVLILLNAVYFKGDWTEPFNPDATRPGSFTLPNNTTIELPMMSRRGKYPVAQGNGFQVLRLPYGKDGRFGMELFLPDEGKALPPLDAATCTATTAKLKEQDLMLTLPRFELAYKADGLDEVLKQLGMGPAYAGGADLSRISAASPYLSTVQHKTFIKVDETGTEAAAVTGGAVATSMPPQFRVDRPFRFTISDTKTGAILFMGRVMDPSVKH